MRGELGGSLLACAVVRPKFIALAMPATVKLPAAVAAFIALLAVAPPILFDFLRATGKAFLYSKVLIPLKALQHKAYSVIEPPFCPIRLYLSLKGNMGYLFIFKTYRSLSMYAYAATNLRDDINQTKRAT